MDCVEQRRSRKPFDYGIGFTVMKKRKVMPMIISWQEETDSLGPDTGLVFSSCQGLSSAVSWLLWTPGSGSSSTCSVRTGRRAWTRVRPIPIFIPIPIPIPGTDTRYQYRYEKNRYEPGIGIGSVWGIFGISVSVSVGAYRYR